MDFTESMKALAERIVNFASGNGCDLSSFRDDYGVFENQKRRIEFWTKEEALRYHLSGEIEDLPKQFAESQSSFRGFWDESGSIDDLGQAFHLLCSWLLEAKEVDELPHRTIHRCMI